MFLLAAGWLIGGLILEIIFGASFFTEDSTIIYWGIFFGILIALFAGMIIGIFQDIDWTGQERREASSLHWSSVKDFNPIKNQRTLIFISIF